MVLELWRIVIKSSWMIFLGGGGYLLLDELLPMSHGTWDSLALASGLALIYWIGWILMFPSLRHVLIEVFVPNPKQDV
jgi:hypothetical protein